MTVSGGKTMSVTASCPVPPWLSVTVNKIVLVPKGRVTVGLSPVASTVPFCDQA